MYKRAKQSWMKHIDFIILDFLCIQVAFLLAFASRMIVRGYGSDTWFAYNYSMFRMIAVVLAILHICIVFFANTYSGIIRRGHFREFKNIVVHNAILVCGIFVYLSFMQVTQQSPRMVMAFFFIYDVLLMQIVRAIRKNRIISTKIGELDMHHILIVSTREEVADVVSHFKEIQYNYKVVGVCVVSKDDDVTPVEPIDGIPVVGYKSSDAYEYAVRNIVDEVFIYIPEANNKTTGKIANTFLDMGITAHINLDMISSGLPNVDVDRMCGYMVMTGSVNVMSPVGAAVKRLIDIAAGIVGCIITGILFVILAPMIMIADPGPIFFGQIRVGQNGRKFKIYKFRSMYVDAEERKKELMKQNKMEGLMFKMDTDPRIIGSGPDGTRKGLGHWIRALSLDEFPNFYSILKGDMSLVGTRPPTVDEYEQYSLHHKSRLAAKPGLTGIWQVSGRSNITDFEEIVEMDNEYIRNWSFGLDFKIIAMTFVAVFKRKGSV